MYLENMKEDDKLLYEICKRIRYKPIVKNSNGNYVKVCGIEFDDEENLWVKIMGSSTYSARSYIDKLVLYSSKFINKDVYVHGEVINSFVEFSRKYISGLYNVIDSEITIKLYNSDKFSKGFINGTETISFMDLSSMKNSLLGQTILDKNMIDYGDFDNKLEDENFEIIKELNDNNPFLYFG